MTDDYNRRADDKVILEVHGMLQRLDQKMDDFIGVSKEGHSEHGRKIEAVEMRLKPLEDFHDSAKTAGKVALVIGTPTALGIGGGLWYWIKNLFTHGGNP